ncbi:hypothetical protein BU24DRAFT_487844 [Aaosphaeria arxii CBS 175.79]|uniref:Mmc1 C-terminal domain-containing protein n=1 Tax=Aaosphaeria arxii CBS 175.79 TaxID=1450172 RepID=A0A6A5Y774_9PLEO|nr:uncharacterized protein BU24DRAFT_487844 [Aaosphaeria arxii CBS 175.79]KAF2021415.1 hypothetical protein BU24DRAFT_487844 [Aaosphaeria arxii CBS 175.79]
MPPWAVLAPRQTSLLVSRPIDRLPSLLSFRHRSNVSTRTHPGHKRISLQDLRTRARLASTHVSPTAVNVRPHIPAQNQELYNALSNLSSVAESYVNISRVQLALRGLAARESVTRVAVLSLNDQRSAQKLARLLFADPLAEEGKWEKELEKRVESEGGDETVLLRYGDENEPAPPSPLYKIVHIPSRVLQKHNIEVLVSTLNVNVSDIPATSVSESSKEAVLVPKLQATSARGLPVPYPVHKTVVLGEGIESAVAFGRFTSDLNGEAEGMVRVAIELPPPEKETEVDGESSTSMVNVQIATEALDIFRKSLANATRYEQGWFRSGLPGLSQWLIRDLEPSGQISPITRKFVQSIVDDVEAAITREDAQQINTLLAARTPEQTTAATIRHLEEWAEKSHTELRDELDEAFAARSWHKLAWWKLFWRVDDVSMITSELIERRWLTSAEKSAVYLAGRMNQAGFPEMIQQFPITSSTSYHPLEDPASPVVPPPEEPHLSPKENLNISTEVHEPQPWPNQIAASRKSLLEDTIPNLQALAQRLVLTTLSTTSLSSAVSALLYISMPTFSVFEAGVFAALGLVFSLRHMQKLWEGARSLWRAEVTEEGRKTLKQTEELVRLIVRSTSEGKVVSEDEGVKERRAARNTVAKVREVLAKSSPNKIG